MSVFTHIADAWSDWLVEMHRLLASGGVLIASFLGEGMWEPLVGEPYREDKVGMSVMHHWEGPEAWVFHSEWWLREHWGRAFDVLTVQQPPRSAAPACRKSRTATLPCVDAASGSARQTSSESTSRSRANSQHFRQVCVSRSGTRYLGARTNLGGKRRQLRSALRKLRLSGSGRSRSAISVAMIHRSPRVMPPGKTLAAKDVVGTHRAPRPRPRTGGAVGPDGPQR